MAELPVPIPDLITGILPAEEVSILAGASGAGKTFLTFELLRCAQHNEDFFGHALKPDMTLGYIAADRTWRAYAHTLSNVGIDVSRLKVRSLVDDASIDENRLKIGSLSLLVELLNSLLPCDLIVVDPMIIFFGANPREYHLMAAPLITLNRWCRKTGVTLLGTHHSTKARTDFTFKRPQDRINGSAALLGFSSSQLFLMEPEPDGPPHHQLFVVSHTAPPATIGLLRGEDGCFRPLGGGAYAGAEELAAAAGGVDDVALKVLECLPPQGAGISVGRNYVVQALHEKVSAPTVDRRLKALLTSGLIVRAGRGEYQRASSHSPAL